MSGHLLYIIYFQNKEKDIMCLDECRSVCNAEIPLDLKTIIVYK